MLGKGNCVIKPKKQTTNQLRRNAQIKQTNKHKQTSISQGNNESIAI